MSDNKKNSSDDGMWLVYAAVSVLVIATAIPAMIAAVFYVVFRGRVSRWMWAAVGLVTGMYLVANWSSMSGAYGAWMRNLVHGDFPRWQVPLDFVLSLGVLAAAAISFVAESAKPGGRVYSTVEKVNARIRGTKDSILHTDHTMPTNDEFDRLASSDFSSLADGSSAAQKESSFVMGVKKDGTEVRITEKEIGMHMLAFGGTGSGKTVSLQVIAGGLLDLGWDGILLDLKEDTGQGGLREWCEEYAGSHAMAYQELALSNANPSYTFDPLFGLDADEARDTILSLTRFDDEYYKNVSIKVLGQVLKLLYWAHEAAPHTFDRPNLAQIANIMSEPDLAKALKRTLDAVVGYQRPKKDSNGKVVKDSNGKPVTEFVPGLMTESGITRDDFDILRAAQTDKNYQQQANSWGAKIGNLYETQAGRTILRPNPNLPDMDVTKGGLTYIGLDSTSKLDLSKVISASVLQRIATDAAQRTHGKITGEARKKFIIIDEASIVDRTIVHALLSKARSAGVAVILATQGPRDWMDRDGDDFAKLSQNTNVALIMNQGEPESATICADYIGKQEVVQANLRYQDGALDDSGSVRETRDYIVQPDELRQLGIGQGVIRIGKPETKVSYVKVIPRNASGGGTKKRSSDVDAGGSSPFGVDIPNVAAGVPRPPQGR